MRSEAPISTKPPRCLTGRSERATPAASMSRARRAGSMADGTSEAMIEGVSAWVRQESPTHDRAGVNAMMDLVAADVADAPVAVERVPGQQGLGDTLILRAGPGSDRPGILVMSHLDTVHPLGTIDHDLPLRVEGDRLYGPGVYDMKAGAYLALQAFKDAA